MILYSYNTEEIYKVNPLRESKSVFLKIHFFNMILFIFFMSAQRKVVFFLQKNRKRLHTEVGYVRKHKG